MSDVEVAPLFRSTAERSEHAIKRIAVVLGTALASVVAFCVTDARCGAVALGPLQSRSRYCRALNLPARPESVTSLVLVGLIFALPLCLAFCMSSARWRANADDIPRRFGILIGVLIASSFVLSVFANHHALGLTD